MTHHLRPAQGLGRRQFARCLGKDVCHALGEHERQVGRADVLPAAHVDEPPLLALGLLVPAAEPRRIQAGWHVVAGQEEPDQRGELPPGIAAVWLPLGRRLLPSVAVPRQRAEGLDEGIAVHASQALEGWTRVEQTGRTLLYVQEQIP